MTTWTTTASSSHLERLILTGMIVSDRALRVIGLAYKPSFFVANFSREIAKWCLAHQIKYNCSPKADIQILFEAHRRNGLDQETSQLIAHLLASLSTDFERQEQFNEQLCIDTAMVYFRERSLTILNEHLTYHLEMGNLNAASAAVAEFMASPDATVSLGIEPLRDMAGTREAFEERAGLLELPGDFGKLIGPLEREWLLMIVGKYKGAKSYTCQYLAQQSILSHLNVAWFDFELGERRLRRRFAHGWCGMPLKPPRHGRLLMPVWDCRENQTGECTRYLRTNQTQLLYNKRKPEWDKAPKGYQPCVACQEGTLDTWFEEKKWELLDWRTAWRKNEAVAHASMGARLKIQCWPKFSAGISDIEATLQIWQHLDNFIPDVIIVDQPDIMRLEGKGDIRHKIDELWKRLGAIPQRLRCLLIAPSQAGGKEAQKKRRLHDSDVAEDSRKLGHVDMSIKIDQDDHGYPDSPDDDRVAQRAIYSIGVGRDDGVAGDKVMVRQCLALGQAIMDSRFI